MAHHPAAFINALSESRDFDLALKHLQQTWNDYRDMRAENVRLREQLGALANSQSLLAMILHLGDDDDGSGIMPAIWQNEELSKFLREQILENRRYLTVTSQHHSTPGE